MATTKTALELLQEELASTKAALAALTNPAKDTGPVDPVTYHSVAPFIRVPIMRAPGSCSDVQFTGGKLTTDDPVVIAVMEATIRTGGSGFSHAPISTGADVADMRADLANLAATNHAKLIKAGLPTA